MILNIYLVLLLIIIFLVAIGIRLDPLYGIMAGIFLFVISTTLLFTPLTYPTGTTDTISYTYVNVTSGVINTTNTTTTIIYSTLDEPIPKIGLTMNSFIMFWNAIIGITLLIYFIFNWGTHHD